MGENSYCLLSLLGNVFIKHKLKGRAVGYRHRGNVYTCCSDVVNEASTDTSSDDIFNDSRCVRACELRDILQHVLQSLYGVVATNIL